MLVAHHVVVAAAVAAGGAYLEPQIGSGGHAAAPELVDLAAIHFYKWFSLLFYFYFHFVRKIIIFSEVKP